ncbi:MAG: TetR/AcrR family transcriptional regulator [Acidiferrobacter sp.]
MMTSVPSATTPLAVRERLLQTASRLFYEQGIRATGIDRIIAEAGVAKMSFYRHFPSKNHLVVAYLEQRHQHWMGRLREGLGLCQAQGIVGLVAIAPMLRAWFAEPDFRGCAFLNALAESGHDPTVRRIVQQHKEELRRQLTALIAPKHPERETLGRLALVIVEGAIVQAQTHHDPRVADDAGRLLAMLNRPEP